MVLMNENEARPCGGFVTAYGIVKLPFGGAQLRNSFDFPDISLGDNQGPLKEVSEKRKFWDLGDTVDLSVCAEQFAQAYEQAEGQALARVILVQSGVIERWLAALGGIKAGEYALDQHNFFATTSRLVADVDRHDEAALASRKSPLGQFGKQLMLKSVIRFWRWPSVTRAFGTAQEQSELYWHRVGEPRPPHWQRHKDRLVTVSEWNLGGGKSSRYLDKSWQVGLRQRTPELWEAKVHLTVQHLGAYDQPLSQVWRGGFELNFFQGQSVFIPAEIEPGGIFSHTESVTIGHQGLIDRAKEHQQLWVYAPPYQNWKTAVQVSALGQQVISPKQTRLVVQENTGRWQGLLPPEGQGFAWRLEPDKQAPFLTWHKPLFAGNLDAQMKRNLQYSNGDTLVEVHFNEAVDLVGRESETLYQGTKIYRAADLGIRLIDRDFAVSDVTANPLIKKAVLYPDIRTLLLNIRPEIY